MTSPAQQLDIDLSVTIAGIHLKNPVMAASGTCGYGEELSAFLDINAIGAIVTKGISLSPASGNPPPPEFCACGMPVVMLVVTPAE